MQTVVDVRPPFLRGEQSTGGITGVTGMMNRCSLHPRSGLRERSVRRSLRLTAVQYEPWLDTLNTRAESLYYHPWPRHIHLFGLSLFPRRAVGSGFEHAGSRCARANISWVRCSRLPHLPNLLGGSLAAPCQDFSRARLLHNGFGGIASRVRRWSRKDVRSGG